MPVIIILIIAAILTIFGISALTIVMPMLGSMLWAAVFLAAAYFVPEAKIYSSEKTTITLKTVFGLLGVSLVVITLLGIQIQSFFGAIATQPVMGAAGLEGVVVQLQTLGIEPASLGAILITIAGTVLGVLFIDKFVYKRKLFKRR